MKYESIVRCERKADRRRVLMRAVLHCPQGTISVRVRDMSTAGARIVAQEVIPQNCDAIFKMGSIFIAARIVWGEGNQAGLRFYRHLPPDKVFEQAVDAESRWPPSGSCDEMDDVRLATASPVERFSGETH